MEKTLNLSGAKCPALVFNAPGVPIVFFHGLSYNTDIWQQIGIAEALMEKRIPFLALDMPYGIKSRCQPKSRDPQKNIDFAHEALKTALGDVAPVVVGASIGGNMALRYAVQYPVKGLLLVAPARSLEPDLAASYGKFKFPSTIIWGTEDTIIPSEDMRVLADKLPNSKLIIYNGCGHSAYKEQPDRFRHDLLELYAHAET
ncbi:MAG: alpha/beta hydrolase [Candidatus Bathyarchaeota archaeon]|nr:alpha/beta hydrolase [Candidatus Bathyarchaeota archaeon]